MVVRQSPKGVSVSKAVAQPLGRRVQRFQALDNRAAVDAGQRAPRADPVALNRAVDDPGQVLVSRAKVADHLPDGVRRCC